MKITFLGQGLDESDNSVGYHLMNYLNKPDFHSFTGITAFASQAGVYGLSGHIKSAKQNFRRFTIILGVDQGGTSKEALLEVLDLDIDSYIFYQQESPIFHPKIYLFEGDEKIKLIVGSSNLTASGLFTNVESSILIEFDSSDKDGEKLLNELKIYYKSLFDFTDQNLFKIDNTLIMNFEAKGIIPDEATRRKQYNGKKSAPTPPGNGLSGITIPKRKISNIPSLFLTKKRASQIKSNRAAIEEVSGSTNQTNITASIPENSDLWQTKEDLLVWESGPLTERDLNIPKGETTNATGSMLFKKGLLQGIDQRHHFRDKVFSALPWLTDTSAATSHLERAIAFFHIIIEGDYKGVFPLMITHNTKMDTRTYLQKNSMTSLSWGKAKDIVAREDLIGKSIKLYKNRNDEVTSYVLDVG